MDNYDPYTVYFNGGFQQFDGYCYSNITSSVADEVLSQEPEDKNGNFQSTRPPRTLKTIAPDSSTSGSSKNKFSKNGQDHSKQDQIISKAPRKSQEPAYRFSPYAFDDASQLSEEATSISKNWTRNPTDFNLLVVPSLNAVKSSAVAINLRRPDDPTENPIDSGSSSSSNVGIPYSYPVPLNVEVRNYTSSVSNRMGVTGPLSLQKAQNPVAHSEGIGNYLLRKMGWSPGAGIGARPKGDQEPLANLLEQKLDKKGLGQATPLNGGRPAAVNIKLPLAFLNEICLEKNWKFPTFDLVLESGPAHAKIFKYDVTLNGRRFSGDEAGTKKLAKANAARACLQDLKFLS